MIDYETLKLIWWLFIGVLLTGLYTGRLFFTVFHGPRRYQGELHHSSPMMESAMLWPLVPLAIGAIFLGYLPWPVPILGNKTTIFNAAAAGQWHSHVGA